MSPHEVNWLLLPGIPLLSPSEAAFSEAFFSPLYITTYRPVSISVNKGKRGRIRMASFREFTFGGIKFTWYRKRIYGHFKGGYFILRAGMWVPGAERREEEGEEGEI